MIKRNGGAAGEKYISMNKASVVEPKGEGNTRISAQSPHMHTYSLHTVDANTFFGLHCVAVADVFE